MKNVLLNDIEAKAVYDLIFGPGSSLGLQINEQDKREAALLLDELIKRSCQMSFVEGIFRGAVYSFNPTISSLVKSIIKSYYSNCYEAAKDGKYYESVRATIALKWKSPFQIRKQTGEW